MQVVETETSLVTAESVFQYEKNINDYSQRMSLYITPGPIVQGKGVTPLEKISVGTLEWKMQR